MRRCAILPLTVGWLAAIAPADALAQGTTGFAAGDIAQRLSQMSKPMIDVRAPPSPLTRLRKGSREWIERETKRQVETPRAPLEVLVEIERELGGDIRRLARRERIRPDDISNAVLLKIMYEAEGAVRREIGPGHDPVGSRRLAEAEALLREALDWQTQVSLALAMM